MLSDEEDIQKLIQHICKRSVNETLTGSFGRVATKLTVETDDGKELKLDVCDPNLLLSEVVRSNPALADQYRNLANKIGSGPDRPWRVVLGFDEFSPTDDIKPNNSKKVMLLSFNFLELGSRVLSLDDSWCTPLVVRTHTIDKIKGGFPTLMREYLRLHLLGPRGASVVGIPLEASGAPLLIFASLTHMLADGLGHQMVLDWRGPGSIKPCFKHSNVWKTGSGLAGRRPGNVEACCTDASLFRSRTSKQFEDLVDLLALSKTRVDSGLMTPAQFERLQFVSGQNYNPHGLMSDLELRALVKPCEIMTYDWVHCLLQDGVLSVEVDYFVEAAEVSFLRLDHFFQGNWNMHGGSHPHKIFTAWRANRMEETGHMKVTASEMLCLYGLIRHFVETRLDALPAALYYHREAFYAACEIVDILLMAKYGLKPLHLAAAEMREAVSRCMRSHIAAYGTEGLKPKHHWCHDVAEQLERDASLDIVLDCFVIERLHKRVKSIAARCDSRGVDTEVRGVSWESSVLARLYQVQLERGATSSFTGGLRGKTIPAPRCPSILLASRLLSERGAAINVGDVVFCGARAGQVVACVEMQFLHVHVRVFAFVRKLSTNSGVWVLTLAEETWPVSDGLQVALAWYSNTEGGDMTIVRM